MCAFRSVDDACSAGRKVLADLDWFNDGVHQLRTKFHVRCGVNFGEVMIPEVKPLEEVSDHVIDVAGHLQKYAEQDSLWVSDEAYKHLQDRGAYTPVERRVDDHGVFAFRVPSGGV